jgi:hypothetical protein
MARTVYMVLGNLSPHLAEVEAVGSRRLLIP